MEALEHDIQAVANGSGGDVEEQGTYIHRAAWHGCSKVVKVLLQNGAYVFLYRISHLNLFNQLEITHTHTQTLT